MATILQEAADRWQRYARALDFAAAQLRRLIETCPDSFPIYTVGGKWRHGGEAWTNWCEGFLGGQLWLLHGTRAIRTGAARPSTTPA